MIGMTRSYTDQIDSIERQMRQLRARRQDVMARHSKRMRKAEQAATFEAGRITLSCFEDGWTSVDFGKLEDVMSRNASIIGACAVSGADADPDKAASRLKLYQKSARGKAAANAAQAEGGDGYGHDDE